MRLDADPPEETGLSPLVCHECDVCEWRNWTTVGSAVLDQPAVVAFATDRDLDPRSRPYWGNDYIVTNEHVEIRSRDPWRVAVRFSAPDAELVVVADGHLDVVSSTTDP